MLERRIKQEIRDFLDGDRKEALMVTGARQVGKTYIIRECAKEIYKNIVEINFVENQQAVKLFANTTGSKDILLRLSALTDVPMIPGETLIFFDEVQECPEIVTAIKFLVEDGQYRYILSGSLLGVELKDIRSVPVGYLSILEMYPLDFREFCEANRVSQTVMDKLKECFEKKQPVDELIHEKMMELFRLYLIVGGMPAVVDAYIRTNNLKEVLRIQQGIVQLYYKDIAKYDKDNKLYLDEIFVEFVAMILRCKMYTKLKEEMKKLEKKPNYMTVPAAIRELEKIEMTRQTDNIYRLDHAVTAKQKVILKAFGLDANSIKYFASELSKELKKSE